MMIKTLGAGLTDLLSAHAADVARRTVAAVPATRSRRSVGRLLGLVPDEPESIRVKRKTVDDDDEVTTDADEILKIVRRMAVALGSLDLVAIDICASRLAYVTNNPAVFQEERHGDALRIAMAYSKNDAKTALVSSQIFSGKDRGLTSAAELLHMKTNVPRSVLEVITMVALGQSSYDPWQSLSTFASKTGLDVDYLTALIANASGDQETLSTSLRRLASKIWGMSPSDASIWISLGSGDIGGIERLADKVLDCDVNVAEGLLALGRGGVSEPPLRNVASWPARRRAHQCRLSRPVFFSPNVALGPVWCTVTLWRGVLLNGALTVSRSLPLSSRRLCKGASRGLRRS
jgi:hypothetical protein